MLRFSQNVGDFFKVIVSYGIIGNNWKCIKIDDGHSFKSLVKNLRKENNSKKPLAFIINTIKGKGIKEFENDPIWHARQLQGSEIKVGKKRLGIK